MNATLLRELLAPIGSMAPEIRGDPDRLIDCAASIRCAGPGCVTFATRRELLLDAVAERMRGAAVICGRDVVDELPDLTLVVVDEPKLAFALVAVAFCRRMRSRTMGGATIYDGVSLEPTAVVEPGAVVGAPGFGYVRTKTGALVPFPQIGGVIVEQEVRIGANCTVPRGALESTVLRRGVKLDAGVHAGHGCVIGEHTAVAAHAVVGGHVTVGARCFLGVGCFIREGVVVGDDATIGAGAIVTRDVPSGATVVGAPAELLADFLARRRACRS